MKVAAVVSILLLAVAAEAGYVTEKQYQSEFSRYVKSFNKKYIVDDFFHRYEIFKSNLDQIQIHNSQSGQTSTMGVNQFTDMTGDEFAAKMTGYLGNNKKSGKVLPLERIRDAPASLDWREKGAVTGVKDQGSCGSCWAFSATGSAEGAWFIAKNKLVSMSEQQMMDCSKKEGNQSCNGGLMDLAFDWMIKNKGICSEEDYPYTAKDSKTCNSDSCSSVASISSYANVAFDQKNPTDDTALMAAVQKGPVSVAIQASSSVFQMYTGGVITSDKCGTRLDHGVLLVGYGTDEKAGDYWVVKNSWGAKWGEQGYVRLARGMNQCGVNTDATLPIV